MNIDVGIGSDAHGEFKVVRRAELGVDIETPRTILHDYFVNASVEALPFRDKAFPVAYAYNVLEHVPHPRTALHELVRVAKEVRIRQDRWYDIGSYATPSHLWFQRTRLRFLPYPRTRIGILASKLLRAILTFRVEWSEGRIFSAGKFTSRLMTESHFQEIIRIEEKP